MLGHAELVAELERLKDAGDTTNAKLSKLLGIPSSRVADIFAGRRRVSVDEMKVLVEEFGLEADALGVGSPSAENLAPLLDALLPLSPPGLASEQSVRALAEALSYGLGLLGDLHASSASADAVMVAARGAVSRFRETARA